VGAPRKPQIRSERITIRLTPAMLAEVTQVAEDDGRTVAGWITRAIQTALKAAKAKPEK